MDILFIHQNFPAQFANIFWALSQSKRVRIAVITDAANSFVDRCLTVRYRFDPSKVAASKGISRAYALRAERGRLAAKAMQILKSRGFAPSVIIGHVGWGETLFAKDVFPGAKPIVHAEFFYSAEGADVGFDPEFSRPLTLEERMELRARNAPILASLNDADVAISPTQWQASRFPTPWRSGIKILHEGVDTDALTPQSGSSFQPRNLEIKLTGDDEVVTFVARNLEPYRGFHIFARALPEILSIRSRAHAVIVGGDGVSYGSRPDTGGSWKDIFLNEVRDRLPQDRVHVLPRIPFRDLVSLFRISSAHVYLTYPFVLSWSLLQAMSIGAPIVASRTAPVLEFLDDETNGLLFDFFNTEELIRTTTSMLATGGLREALRTAGRQLIRERLDLKRVCLPKWLECIGVS